jgi:hypothetical protein
VGPTPPHSIAERRVEPITRALRARHERNRKTWQPLQRARRVSPNAARGKTVKKPEQCTPKPAPARDNVTGWLIYYCGKGVLLTPTEKCVGPECQGGKPGQTVGLGYAGDIGAGTKGSFLLAGRTAGVTAMDGIEIAKGLAAINDLRDRGEIDGYYAAAAKNAFIERTGAEGAERAAPFEEPAALGAPLGSGALKRLATRPGEDVGPSVTEACRCTPREPDGRDPVSGWLIYYVGKGVLLTPTKKCIGGGGRPPSFWAQTWHNVLSLVKPTPPPAPVPARTPPTPPPAPGAPAPPPAPPAPPGGYLCYDPRIWPGGFRPQPTPCEPPKIEYPG